MVIPYHVVSVYLWELYWVSLYFINNST